MPETLPPLKPLRGVRPVFGAHFDILPRQDLLPALEGRLPRLTRHEIETAYALGVAHGDSILGARYLDAFGGPLHVLAALAGYVLRIRADDSDGSEMRGILNPMNLAYLLRATTRPAVFTPLVCHVAEAFFEALLVPRRYGSSCVALYLHETLTMSYAGDSDVTPLLERYSPAHYGWRTPGSRAVEADTSGQEARRLQLAR